MGMPDMLFFLSPARSWLLNTRFPFADWFRNSSPYINAHRGRTFVLHFYNFIYFIIVTLPPGGRVKILNIYPWFILLQYISLQLYDYILRGGYSRIFTLEPGALLKSVLRGYISYVYIYIFF